MSDIDGHVAIVGAGHAGGSAAAFLRQYGWSGPITLLGEEPCPPYQRPPLSKAWLKGEATAESLALRPAAFYEQQSVTLLTSVRVAAIDRMGRKLALSGGETLAFDRLILAVGARPRRLPLPGFGRPGVFELRNQADAEALKSALRPGRRIAIVGGGYIGLEVAASARALGAEAVVVEQEARLLARVACPAVSDFFLDYHGVRGVGFVLGAAVASVRGDDTIEAVTLADGREVPCDLVLVGVGAVPNVELAGAAGLACEDGIVVDGSARTSDPAIHAIGDCARRPLPLYGCSARLESVPNALEMAKQAAADLTGRPPPPPARAGARPAAATKTRCALGARSRSTRRRRGTVKTFAPTGSCSSQQPASGAAGPPRTSRSPPSESATARGAAPTTAMPP